MECAAKGSGTHCVGPPVIQCDRCQAVAYCSLSHQILHLRDHQQECERLGQQMRNADILNNFPFKFCEEATRQESRCSFLTRRGLHQLGMWSYECSCGDSNLSDNLLMELRCWNLSNALAPCVDPVSPLSKQLTCWKEYYQWRSIPLDSPVALLLQWPLTIYHAIQLSSHRLKSTEGRKRINIHYLGPDKELLQIASFGELHALLPDYHVHLELVGPAISVHRDGEMINLDSYANCDEKGCKCKMPRENCRKSAVTIRLRKGLYHDHFSDIMKDAFPDLIVAPNAGIAAYPSWKETVELIHVLNVPAVFSDFCEEAAHLAACCLSTLTGSELALPIQINPFRQPMTVEDGALRLPCYSNCFLFGI